MLELFILGSFSLQFTGACVLAPSIWMRTRQSREPLNPEHTFLPFVALKDGELYCKPDYWKTKRLFFLSLPPTALCVIDYDTNDSVIIDRVLGEFEWNAAESYWREYRDRIAGRRRNFGLTLLGIGFVLQLVAFFLEPFPVFFNSYTYQVLVSFSISCLIVEGIVIYLLFSIPSRSIWKIRGPNDFKNRSTNAVTVTHYVDNRTPTWSPG